MLPEIGATEMLVIAAVALIVVGPKDLPLLLRKIGQFVAKLRGMASEFRASFDEMARQSELDELRKEVQAMREGRLMESAVGADDVNTVMREIDQSLQSGAAPFDPGEPYRYEPTPEEIADVSAGEPEAAPAPEPAKPAPRKRAPAKAATKAKAKPAAPRKRAAAKPKSGAGE